MPEHDPEPRRESASDDAAWRDLVRRLEATDAQPAESPDAIVPPGTPADPEQAHEPPDMPADQFRRLPAAVPGPRDYEAPEEDEDEGFVPEDPPVLGSGDPLTVLAWCGAAGAPLALVLLAILWRGAPSVAWIGLCLAFIVAVGYLMWRLPGQRSGDDDGSRV